MAILFNQEKIIFDKDISTASGRLMGLEIVPLETNNHIAMYSHDELHDLLGHPNEIVLKDTAKKYKIPLSGTIHTCENCAKAKIKIMKLSKESDSKATKIGERISFDISSVNKVSHGGNKFWLLIIDEFTNYCWSLFLKNKSDLPEAMLKWLNNFQCEYKFDLKFF